MPVLASRAARPSSITYTAPRATVGAAGKAPKLPRRFVRQSFLPVAALNAYANALFALTYSSLPTSAGAEGSPPTAALHSFAPVVARNA